MKVSCLCSSLCSSYKILWGLAPSILITGILFIVGPNTTYWASSSYTPWVWSGNGGRLGVAPPLPSTSPYVANTSEETQRNADLHQRLVVGSVAQMEEALSTTFNHTSSPKQIIEIKQAEESSQQEPNKSTFGPNPAPELMMENRQYSKLEQLEAGLARVRNAIRESAKNGSDIPDPHYIPRGPVYRNSFSFHRSYLEMEKQFKVFIYEEGEPPLFHDGPCKSIYAIEGNFIHMMEVEQQIRTQDPERAHVYFLPFSVTMMRHFVYESNSHDLGPIRRTVLDYVDTLSKKYPYWNRSLGADHFMVACHDWGPEASKKIPNMYKNSIRVLCNANTSEGFNPSKDVSLPEIHLLTGDVKGFIGGPSPSQRPILAFFAGGMHGPVRPILWEHWAKKDGDIRVHKYLPKGVSYYDQLKKTKYCLCPSGYEVASPRIVEALYAGCVPVLISDHYVPPFSDVLNWKSFSVEVPVSEIPNLKRILMGISQRQYIRMQKRGVLARKHFEVNLPPKRYDVFYMILHSIWLRRLNVHIHE